jgi:prepilin-type N-terminal cleavage/methylation domain-containing protein
LSRHATLQHDFRRQRDGFTLIEVLLSLGLAALVLAALATAVDVQLRCVQTGRTHVEEAQLARALLHRIGDDLRNAAVINPIESDKIMAGSSGATEDSRSTAGDGELTNSTTFDEAEMVDFESSSGTEDEYVLGLYGESNWMQVDVCRNPRLDQYDYETLSSGSDSLEDRVSAVKTVYYSLGSETGTTSAGGEYRGGLIRREIDRAVTRWAEESGTLSQVDLEIEPIAPEVTDIEFHYHDGTEWVDTWDSSAMGSLPIAVHIAIAIMPREQYNQFMQDWSNQSATSEQAVNFIYSLTVALPVAEGDVSDEETMDETGEAGEAETSDSGASGDTGGGGGETVGGGGTGGGGTGGGGNTGGGDTGGGGGGSR